MKEADGAELMAVIPPSAESFAQNLKSASCRAINCD